MMLGFNQNGESSSVYEGLNAPQFLSAILYSAELESCFLQDLNLELDEDDMIRIRLIPLLLKLLPDVSENLDGFEFNEARKTIASVLSEYHEIENPDNIARLIISSCTIGVRTRQMQPALFWAWDKMTTALSRRFPGKDPLANLPWGISSKFSPLLSSLASPAPAGGNIFVLHGGVNRIHELCQARGQSYRRIDLLFKQGLPSELQAILEVAEFAQIAEEFLEYETNNYFKELIRTLPKLPDDIKAGDQDINDSNSDYCLAFVLLHEIGHVELGHTDILRQKQGKIDSKEAYEFEFAADAFALDTLECLDEFSNGHLAGICDFLNLFARARMHAGQSQSTDTHPSLLDRAETLLLKSKKATREMKDQLLEGISYLKGVKDFGPIILISKSDKNLYPQV